MQAAVKPMRWKLRRRLSVLLYIADAFLDAGGAKKQLRCGVSPMDAQCEMFFDVPHVRS